MLCKVQFALQEKTWGGILQYAATLYLLSFLMFENTS